MAKRISITREQYEEIAALYEDAVMSAEGGMGGRHGRKQNQKPEKLLIRDGPNETERPM